jgi:hypothetical protein
MNRRELIVALAAATVGAHGSQAQPVKSRHIGVVLLGGPHHADLAGLREGMKLAPALP